MRQEIFGPLMGNVRPACDLACGTGTAALDLARQSIPACALGLSPARRRAARAKAKCAAEKVRVIRAGMRDSRLPEPVDQIACESGPKNLLSFKRTRRGAW